MIYRTECRMDVCSWIKERSRAVVARSRDGLLIRYEVLQGMSHHPDDNYPERYAPGLRISWARKIDYAFCSRSRPAYVFLDELDGRPRWVAHLLDLTNLFGYNRPSAAAYMHACHQVAVGGEISERRISQFGYRSGTPSAQIVLNRPADIASRRIVLKEIAAGER